jgi:hypothetical protein
MYLRQSAGNIAHGNTINGNINLIITTLESLEILEPKLSAEKFEDIHVNVYSADFSCTLHTRIRIAVLA